eukprot:969991_1
MILYVQTYHHQKYKANFIVILNIIILMYVKKKLSELNENQKLWLHVDFKHDSNFTDKLNGKCDKQFTYPTFAYKQDEDEDDEDKQDEDNKDGKDNKDNKDGKTNKGKGKGKAKGKKK